MRARLGRLTLALFACSLSACVESAVSDVPSTLGSAGGGAGAAVGGAAAGSAGAAQLGGAGSGGAAGAANGTGGVVECSSFVDQTGWTLPVHIKNEMSQTLYLGQDTMACEVKRLFQVEDGSRTILPSLDTCHSSCQAMMETGPVQCPAVCATPSTVALEPGQSITLPWDGLFGVEQTLPQQCLGAGVQGPAVCTQAKRIEANAFTFIATAGTRRECLQPGGTCTCTPNANGGCVSASSLIGGTIYTSEFLIKLEPGETSPSGEPPYIEILFRD
jgi:hypothetical protein